MWRLAGATCDHPDIKFFKGADHSGASAASCNKVEPQIPIEAHRMIPLVQFAPGDQASDRAAVYDYLELYRASFVETQSRAVARKASAAST